jgi:hypothetical protein
MNFYATITIQQYEQAGALKSEPPQEAPTAFWLDVLYYQKIFNTEYKKVMGYVTNMSHLSIHAEEHLEEMVLKWDEEALYWMFDEIGSFILREELKLQDEHEYVVQKASHSQFSTYEVYNATEDCVAWGADTTKECYEWINQEECEKCGEWTDDFFRNEDGVVCVGCYEDE